MSDNWSTKEDEKLTSLHKDGDSFGVISAIIGRSRNACIGRAARLGLPRRPHAVPPMVEEKPKKEILVRIRKPMVIKHKVSEGGIDISHLGPFSCRYIINDNPTKYCGQLIYKKSYCKCHAKICYRLEEKK